jgi:hypothetical protein
MPIVEPASMTSSLSLLREPRSRASGISATRRSADAEAQGFRLSTQPATGTAGKPHQINLQRSLIDGTINPFASVNQLFWVRGRQRPSDSPFGSNPDPVEPCPMSQGENDLPDHPRRDPSTRRCAASRHRAPQAATPQPLRRAQLRIFVVRCGLPCDPPVGGHSCNGGMIPRFSEGTNNAFAVRSLEPRVSLVGHSRHFEREVGMTASPP